MQVYESLPNDNSIWNFPSHLLEGRAGSARDSSYRTVQPRDLNHNYLPKPNGHLPHYNTSLQRESSGQQLFVELDEQLNTCLGDVNEWAAPANWAEIENTLDHTMMLLSQMQDRLLDLYPNTAERAKILGNYLHHRLEGMATALQRSGLPKDDQKAVCAHFNTCFAVLVNSMLDQSAAVTPVNQPCYLAPRDEALPPLYIEPQYRTQCGRHAANMFFGQPLLEAADDCEDIGCDQLFSKMNEHDPNAVTEGPLAMYDMGLMAYIGGRQPGYQRGMNPDALDQLPGDFVLTTGGHYVCFKKVDDQWYLLDSFYNVPRQIAPSVYLQEVFAGLDGNQYSEANLNGRIAVICRAVPQGLAGFVRST